MDAAALRANGVCHGLAEQPDETKCTAAWQLDLITLL